MMKSLKGSATKNRHPVEKSNVERKRKVEWSEQEINRNRKKKKKISNGEKFKEIQLVFSNRKQISKSRNEIPRINCFD